MQGPGSRSLSESNPLSNLGFDELLALADAAWAHSNTLPGNGDGLKSHCIGDQLTNPINKLHSHHHHLSLEQHFIIHDNSHDPQGTSCSSCCSIPTSQVAPPIPVNGIRAERRQAVAVQINVEEKDQGPEKENVSAKKIDNNGNPHIKEGQPKRTQESVRPKPVQMPESPKTSCKRSFNFDKGARDESSADKESVTMHLGRENGVVTQEMNVGLPYDLNTSVKQASNSHMPFPNDTQARSTFLSTSNPHWTEPNEKRPGKRKYLRWNSTPTKLTGELTEPVMAESTKISCRWSLNFDKGVVEETHASLPHDQNTLVKQSLSNYMSLPSTSLSESNPLGVKLNANSVGNKDERNGQATAQDGNICDSQISTTKFQVVGSKRKNSVNFKHIADSSINLIGTQYNGLTSYQTMFWVQYSNIKKKRRSTLSSSAYSSTSEMQKHHNFALEKHHLPLGKPLDIACKVRWKIKHNVEVLAEQFRQLNINTEARDLALHEQNALVPIQGSFDPIKKQHPQPKVHLDDKARWSEEGRNIFRGQADSFIAQMHLVEGDRRSSQWKGGSVDSVVGVFLTQNVSDHLSSSASMSLGAGFPQKSNGMCNTYNGEGTSLVVNKPQAHVAEAEENTERDVKLLNQFVHNQHSMTIDIVEHSGESEAINSNDSCRITSSVTSLTDESKCRLSESSQRHIKEHHSPTGSDLVSAWIEEGEEKSCYDRVRKELNDIVSYRCPVDSSQISGDFSNDQNPKKIGSCSDSNSEVEDLSSTAKYNIYNSSISFSKLIEMVSSAKFHEVYSQRSKSTENLGDSCGQSIGMKHDSLTESLKKSNVTGCCLEESTIPSHEYSLDLSHSSGVLEVNCSDPFKTEASSGFLKDKDENDLNRPSFQTAESAGKVASTHSQSIASQVHPQESFFNISGQTQDVMYKERGLDLGCCEE